MANVAGEYVSIQEHSEVSDRGETQMYKTGTAFDPSEQTALIRALAYNSMHGDLQAHDELSDEIRRLHKTPFEAAIAVELSKPDKTRKLPVATFALKEDEAGIISFDFHPGCLDFTSSCSVLSIRI